MVIRMPVVLLFACALAAPGALVDAKDKDKDKSKDKQKQKSNDGSGQEDRYEADSDGKMTICHIPPGNSSARHTISVGESAWSAHRGHGDRRGACAHGGPTNDGRFDALDANRDGVISVREWRGERAAFDRLDRDHNGVITRAEFYRS